ncbi:nuclear transport factor 2 family protein [Pedobacter sp. ISL-68]|uniref:nuclear transport factor 2 family protein n=1 Tax=unclassified Pedobacter TaxID=2628915 RepID=UPI001BEA85C9|nr:MULTISPECIES: nuclear transport factor 2 family protein [unclassified Pedobacter]MBT2561383.1 nuclear transport factor 2 family protein [Pedobacter sp. ISL-64]MBT2590772.1 nuclear transport factor 2 family protein [Pedobacter sp. ISL-68]
MGTKETIAVWQYKNEVEKQFAEHIISLEETALEKWFKGDTSGYAQLWSKRSFTYFDAVEKKRLEDFASMADLFKRVEGKLSANSYEVRSPRVQIGVDMAVLTYQLFAKTNLLDIDYNCIEVFQKEEDGNWYAIHSTWSIIRPMEKDFSKLKDIV